MKSAAEPMPRQATTGAVYQTTVWRVMLIYGFTEGGSPATIAPFEVKTEPLPHFASTLIYFRLIHRSALPTFRDRHVSPA